MRVKALGIGLVLIGCAFIAVRIYQISHMSFVTGKVLSTESYRGDCRRTSGRMQDCTRIKAKIQFTDPANSKVLEQEFDLGRYSAAVIEGTELPLMFPKGSPEEVALTELHEGWVTPIAIFMVGLVLTLISGGKVSEETVTSRVYPTVDKS